MRALPFAIGMALLGCASSKPAPSVPEPPERPRRDPRDPVVDEATTHLAAGDLAAAKRVLEERRWLARDRSGATLLYSGCLLAEGNYADAIDALREHLAKTPRLRTEGDRIAVHLLRHHASGGGESARSAREACYFGLYALKALDEAAAARKDLAWARRDAPRPERLLLEAALP